MSEKIEAVHHTTRPEEINRPTTAKEKAPQEPPKDAPSTVHPDSAKLSEESSKPEEVKKENQSSGSVLKMRESFWESLKNLDSEKSSQKTEQNRNDIPAGETGEKDKDGNNLDVATYNVAGGNEEKRKNFKDQTSDYLAQQVASGNVDVAALQEVSHREGGMDFNMEIMKDVFKEKLPENFKDGKIDYYSLDASGKPMRDEDGKPIYDPKSEKVEYTC